MTALLRLEGVACIRGGRLLFEGLDLALGAGEALVLTGPNGAGKSSLMRIAAGLLRASAGKVERASAAALADETAALDERLTLGRALGFWAGSTACAQRREWSRWASPASPGCRCGCFRPGSASARCWLGSWRRSAALAARRARQRT
jgi:ABC-type transport system involved in cytochrome c biogenesis ATPase subunit